MAVRTLPALATLAICMISPAIAQSPPPLPPQDECPLYTDPRGSAFSTRAPRLHGDGFVQEIPRALQVCEEAARLSPRNAELQVSLSRIRALAGDHAGALQAAQSALDLSPGNGRALLANGALLARTDPAAALPVLRKAAAERQGIASYNLGLMAANGLLLRRDPQDAINFFRDAARDDDVMALLMLAQMAYRGEGMPRDRTQAEQWWRRAAERLRPEPVPDPARLAAGEHALDTTAPLAFYRRRANAGEAWAQLWLGVLHETGWWVPRDLAVAASWYRRAAQAGNGLAASVLAGMYQSGRGVPRDEAESRRWRMTPVYGWCTVERSRMAQVPGATECDRLAGDQYQPDSAMPGIPSDCVLLDLQPALAACQRAVAQQPAVPRLRAQYAKTLALANRFGDAEREARLAADHGSTKAMILLAILRARGLGMPQDIPGAIAWYLKASNAGDPHASRLLTTSVNHGKEAAWQTAEAKAVATVELGRYHRGAAPAVDPLRSRAEKGEAYAQYHVGASHEAKRDMPMAIEWYARAARQGFRPAAMHLGEMYQRGERVTRDPAAAIGWYRRPADAGDAEARYRLAVLLMETGQFAEAIARLGKAVDHDDWRAMLDLGIAHEGGVGVPRDPTRAASLYEQAASRSTWARSRLGTMALTGVGMPRDPAKARKWLESAGDDRSAMNNLGVMAEKGLGMPVDFKRARDLYLKAIESAPPARGNLEAMYERDAGAPATAADTAAWYRPAADAGIAWAQWRLGRLYRSGTGGVQQDLEEAARLLEAAAWQGHVAARTDAAEAYYALAHHHAAGLPNKKAADGYENALAAAAAMGHPEATVELGLRFGPRVADRARQVAAERTWPAPPQLATGIAQDPDPDPRHRARERTPPLPILQGSSGDQGMHSTEVIIPTTPLERGRAAQAAKR